MSLRQQVESPVWKSTPFALLRRNSLLPKPEDGCKSPVKSQFCYAGDIRLNFFPTMAEGSQTVEQRTPLNKQQLLVTRPNSRVVQLEAYNSLNNKGVPHQIYCPNDDYNPRKGKPICPYNGIWHTLLHNKKGKFTVGQELPEVHDYNILDKGKAREEEPPQTVEVKTLQEALVPPMPPGPITMFKSPWTSAAPGEIDEEDHTRGGLYRHPPPQKVTATTATSWGTLPEIVPKRGGLEWPRHRARGARKRAKKKP